MKFRKLTTGVALATTGALALSACGGGSDDSATGGDDVLRVWHYENPDSAMGIAWDEAMEIFEEETGATVEFEERSFEQIRSTASQILNSDQAPDVLEYNKGNATAGLLSSQGLLRPLDDAVAEYGWDDMLAPSLQTTARYDEQGIMGSGDWFGIPTYGEYVQVYYNVEMFDEYGIEVPETLEEFEDVLQQFVDEGVTPLAEAAAEYPLGQLWYQLALTKADRDWVDAYQLYTADVDWNDEPLTYATDTIKDWTDAGFISDDATGMTAEDAGVAFIDGTYPIFFSGSWWYGRFLTEIDHEWSTFLFPGEGMSPGSAGNMWVIPERSQNAELAEQFIDITMRPEIQALMGDNGGVPVAADPDDITDEESLELIENFNTLNDRDGIAFYPDWPTPTFYDELNAALQELLNGSLNPQQVREQLSQDYESGVADALN